MTTATLEYRVYGVPIEAKAYGMNEDGTLTIKGIASTTNKDYANEIVSPEVIKSLAKQAVGLNLHLDHERKYRGGIGAIINAWEEDNNLWVEAKILSEWAPGIKERLDIGMNFGFSISGFPRKERVPEGLLIVDYDLKEITLTYMPMNWDTFGTVEYKSQNLVASNCLTGACNHMLNATSDGETMDKKDTNIEEEPVEPVEKDNTGLLTDEQLNQVRDVMNEYAAEFEPRILEQIEPKLDTIAENAANGAAEKVAERILAELKATKEVKSTEPEVIETEPVDGNVEDEEGESEEVKSEPGIKEPESAPASSEDKEDDEDEVEEKSIEEIVHNEIVKQMNDKNLSSKYDAFKEAEKSKSKSKQMEGKSFLNSPKRDQFGRNKRYL